MHTIISHIRSITPLWLRIRIGPFFAYIHYIAHLYVFNTYTDITVLSIDETLELIHKDKLSIIRFGDGEMSLIEHIDLGFQNKDIRLGAELKKVLQSNSPGLLICVPGIFKHMNLFNKKTIRFNLHHLFKHGHTWKSLLSKNQVYGEAFISRPYLLYVDKSKSEARFNALFSNWENKDIIIIEGAQSRLGVGNNMFEHASSVKRVLCPAEHAFASYKKILTQALTLPKTSLILLSIGPTAKILAYDLFMAGYRVLDIGHIDMEYEMFLRKSDHIVKIPHKYFNEINERNAEVCTDAHYQDEIIAVIEPVK